MKTKNNVQKTILKLLAVVTSFVLLSITVNAQVFWKTVLENNSLNQIAIAMLETKTSTNLADVTGKSSLNTSMLAEFAIVETENPLALEEWMTNSGNFDAKLFSFETEQEAALELESWMFKDNFGKTVKPDLKVLLENYEPEQDNDLQLEAWMINSNCWK